MAIGEMQMMGFHGRPSAWTNIPSTSGSNAGNQNTAATNQNIRNAGNTIAGALEVLTDRGQNPLQGRSSDSDVATVEVNANRLIASQPPQDTTINVLQTAQAQANHGDRLVSTDRAVDSGVFRFEVEANGRTHAFAINVLDSDNNTSVQQMMARAINNANIGVTASTQQSMVEGERTTTLNLTGQTGAGNGFSVTDTTGGLAAAMGVTTANQQARDARFTINGGEERTSTSNEINIAAGVIATLTGEGEANITFGRYAGNMVGAARELVNALNSALRNTNANDGRGSRRFVEDIHGMNRTFASQLSRVGIEVQNNGALAINEDRLRASAENGSLARLFDDRGFGARVERIANNAQNTNHYANVPAPVNFNNNFFDFGNTSNQWNMVNMFG